MSNELKNEDLGHHRQDETELARLEANIDGKERNEVATSDDRSKTILAWIISAVVVGLILLVGIIWIATLGSDDVTKVEVSAHNDDKDENGHSEDEKGQEVKLDAESLESIGIEIEGVTQRPAIARLYVTGTVELNPEKTELATPLVGGRMQSVRFGVGDYVNRGDVLAWISSPQLAQLHGKMHEARTQYELALRNLERVQKAENRVAVLSAKAKLDEADATLKRTRRLIELGAGAGKDLIAAETAYKTAKAEYDFQSNISLNKEIQEARAAVETSRVDLSHMVDEMKSLGVPAEINTRDDHTKDTSLVALRAPLSGMITERKFNSGAGIEANTPVFVISNVGTVYIIANVPQANVNRLVVGSAAEIRTPSVGAVNGRISFIDPRIDEQTRTAKVRLEVANPGGKLRAGMFTEVGFYTGVAAGDGEELVVRTEAIQRTGDKTIVFVPREDEPGAFEVREIEIAGDFEGYTAVKSGLKLGEKVVTKGSFALKTQMQKGELGDDDH